MVGSGVVNEIKQVPCRQPMGKPYRVSSDSAWPLRRADGRTWAESRGASKETSGE